MAYCETDPNSSYNKSDSIRISRLFELSKNYRKQGDFEKSLIYHTEYTRLRDSIQNVNHILKLKELESEKINEQHIKKINELSENNSAQSEIIKELTVYRNIFIASSGFILILLLIIFYNFRNKIKANRKLSVQNEKIRRKNLEIKNQTLRLSKINHELEKLSIVASKTDNAVTIARHDGTIEWVNDGFTRMYGYTLEEFINNKGEKLIDASSSPNIDKILQEVIIQKKSQIYESEGISKEGKKYKTQTTITPILNNKNEIVKFITIDSDISKLKQVEEELQKLIVTKDKFFSIIAHDLKNPFNTLMGLAQLLHHGYDSMNTEKVKHFHKNLYEISKNGYGLLVNLLEWARSQMGKIKFKPEQHNLSAITEETFSLYNTNKKK